MQNWDIRQDKNGIIYFANNEGLVSFDGKYWNIYSLPNKTIVRSVQIGEDNNIYVGGQDEFGYFAPAANGRLSYHPLTQLIAAKDKSFGDVWDIVSFKNSIFFRTAVKIYKITGQAVAVYTAPTEWSYMGICQGRLYAHDHKNGLLVFENNVWSPLLVKNILPFNDPVTAIIPLRQDSVLITTLKSGVYILSATNLVKLNTPTTALIEKQRIYTATAINADWIALGTTNGGVYIIDIKGQLIQSFSKTEGIQNNNVLSIFLDKQSNLWLGLDNGIDCIAYNSAIKRISPNIQDGSGYTAIIYNNNFYAGTSVGLFSVPLYPITDLSFSKGVFTPVANTAGQNWNLTTINGKLLLGHHEGAFIIHENTATPFVPNIGFWNFLPTTSVFPSPLIVAGNYNGLSFFNYSNNIFNTTENIPNFKESSRFVAIDKEDNIWVSHPYHGVHKVFVTPQKKYATQLYTVKDGLPSTLNNHVYTLRNEVVVATEKGIYIYNAAKDIFEPSDFYKNILGQQSIRYIKEDTEGNIWFIHEKSLGVVDMQSKKPTIIYIPELNNKMLSGFEFIYPVNEHNIFVGGEKGFFHINYEKYKKNVPELQVQIRTVKITDKKDSILFGGYFSNINEKQIQATDKMVAIANKWKTIRFEFSSPLFGEQTNLEYSYRLKGFTDTWTEWTNKTEKEYTNLPAATYTLEVKVRNNLGNESAPVSYTFKILPPWYTSIIANCFYFLLLCGGIYYFYKWQRKKFTVQQAKYEEEQKRLQYLHQLEINKAENELIALRNEKLQSEIDFKNSELATSAMHLVQKGELLTKLKPN